MGFLAKWLVVTVAVIAASYVLPGIEVAGFWPALIAALLLGLINAFVRPVLVLLTLPLTVITLGLFLLVLNALLLYLVAALVTGFVIGGFWWALLGSIFISVLSGLMNSLIRKERQVG